MTLPSVTITELDGALGTLPSGQKAFAVVGAASSGPLDTPAAFGRTKDISTTFGLGPMPELAALLVKLTGKPIICVRTGNTTAGTHTDIVTSGVAGTSVVTIASDDTNPADDYEPYFKVITGGTIGTAGIIFQWSLDGGRNLSAPTALGTANSFTFPDSGGIGYAFAAGTLVAGDVVTSLAKAPAPNGTELASALTALMGSGHAWECAVIELPLDATLFDTVTTAFAAKPERWWMGRFRLPTAGEADATYQAAFNTALGAKSSTSGSVCSGSCESVSAISGRQYRRPTLFPVAASVYKVSEEIDIASPELGSLPGVSIRDANGNAKHHDEALNPGLDDMRAVTLRTIEDFPGVYPTNPRLFSAAGSDFEFIQHRRVMALARAALRVYFTLRMSKEILVGKDGYILEEEAAEIEEGARAAMAGVLLAKPKASAVDFVLNRTDNILSTKTLTGQAFVTPLAYVKQINIDLGFRNPALVVRSA